ncbi:Autophagy protein 29 [Maudiozyma exigua]|uniref:Autophagy-related protein 29 n=1 Tax=Maudiozyma exigua TaxID=34358 RepID=A0A9P6WE89_MAUEX|nr:Autophagy protein 29 [Kazachstania exigua]
MNNNNTIVYVKVAGPRPDDFVEPPPFDWSQEKERQLWQFISKLDKQEDHINWEQLSETFDTPIYFLKKRCYKMFSMRLELLKQKIQHKKKILESDTRVIETEQETKPEHDITYPFVEDKDRINSEHTTNDISDRLHNIKLSNYKPPASTKDATVPTGNADRSASDNEPDGDISSSLSVSKSALEEALMARLNF